MLLAIRDRITGVVAWVICGLIIIPFALWGVQDYIGIGNEPAAIKFNDSEMTMYEFERRMQLNRQQLAQRFGGEIPAVLDNNDLIRQQTANQYVNREALVQYAQDNGYGSSAEEIYRNISALPQFQIDGKFSRDAYERQTSSLGYTKTAFEQQVGLDIAIGQLQQGVIASALVTDAQLKDYVKLRRQSRDLEYFILDIEKYKAKIKLSDDDVQTYYDENKDTLLTERQVSLSYLELKIDDLAATVEVDDQTLQELYDANSIPGIADKPETRTASHILLLVDESASAEEVSAKEEQLKQIRERALTEDFAALAKEFSEDAGSAPSGGELGDVARGVMVKPFEDKLFDMQVGEVSEVVKSQFGFHIIKLSKINAAEKPSFAEVKGKIQTAYKNQEAEKLFFEKADLLANLTFEQPDSLDAAAEEAGLTVQVTPLFTESVGQGIATNNVIRTAAFSTELLDNGVNSEAIEISENHVAFIRVADYKPSREKTLVEAKQEIESVLLDEKARALAQADLSSAYERADSGLEVLAKEYGSEVQSAKLVERDNRDIEAAVVEALFLVTDGSTLTKVDLPNGSVGLLKLLSVQDGDLASLPKEEKEQIENEWLTINGRSDFENVLAAYKDSAKIVYNPDLNISPDSEN